MSREADAYRDPFEYREDSPLLAHDDADSRPRSPAALAGEPPTRARAPPTPLPRAQLAAIYAIKLVVPIASTQALPYVNKMLAGLGVPSERDVGYYSGLLSFAHTAGSFSTIYAWGRLSDWVGRTPVIGFGMLGLALSTLLFGASQSIAMAVAARLLGGVFSGFIGVIHSVVGELSDTSNQATAFPFYDIISALGFVIGPIIGGTFEEPATSFGGWFDNAFFRAYPYVLPCIITCALGVLAALLSVSYLRETHPHKAKLPPPEPTFRVEPAPGEVPAPLAAAEKPPSLRALAALPVLRALCAAQWMLGFVAAAFNVGFVLLAYTPVADGGLGMSPKKIAGALSLMGAVSIALKAALPLALRRWDALAVFRATLLTWPATFALLPLLAALARRAAAAAGPGADFGGGGAGVGGVGSGGVKAEGAPEQAALWLAIGFVLFMSRLGCLAFSIVMILTKDHTPTSFALGTTNSLSELAQMLGVAVGAPFISSIFAFSISHRALLGGQLWVVVICVLSLLGDYAASHMAKHRYA
ncbi:MFS general substrate transporter [Phanerochaete sordida]|uniref:MFS general substrate transporter n=1 Tax=Phanerochaete sordida TaxID=48140 RepID=A0A9P3GPE4_9APHY|nr:MFS general substrate transporter [Phanerochaete sordida]